jgi:NADPH:quinone reductase-like Zn-dependent oxidoreductase
VKGDADLVWKIPDNVSFEDAVTFGVGFGTAAQGLFHPTRLGLVEPPAKVSSETWVCK